MMTAAAWIPSAQNYSTSFLLWFDKPWDQTLFDIACEHIDILLILFTETFYKIKWLKTYISRETHLELDPQIQNIASEDPEAQF